MLVIDIPTTYLAFPYLPDANGKNLESLTNELKKYDGTVDHYSNTSVIIRIKTEEHILPVNHVLIVPDNAPCKVINYEAFKSQYEEVNVDYHYLEELKTHCDRIIKENLNSSRDHIEMTDSHEETLKRLQTFEKDTKLTIETIETKLETLESATKELQVAFDNLQESLESINTNTDKTLKAISKSITDLHKSCNTKTTKNGRKSNTDQSGIESDPES